MEEPVYRTRYGHNHVVSLLVLVLFVTPEGVFALSLVDNGYNGLVVGFSQDIEQHHRQTVLDNTKSLFTNASRLLYLATRQRAYFKEVTFLVPQSWGRPETWGRKAEDVFPASLERFNEAHVQVGEEEGIFGRNPFTVRAEGCGKKGVQIYLPRRFLVEDDSNISLERSAKIFIKEWIQYRYGVFSENGFPNDTRYPEFYVIPGTEDIKVTDCVNKPLKYEAMDQEGMICSPKVDPDTGRPTTSDCSFHVQQNNTGITSSLTSQPLVSGVVNLCDSDSEYTEFPHNSQAPTKHNVLCGEDGVWITIMRSPDFKNGKNQASTYKPQNITFKYVQETAPRVVLAIRNTPFRFWSIMQPLVKIALAKFISFDLPIGSEVGLAMDKRGVFRVELSSDMDRQTLAGHIPNRVVSETMTMEWAVDASLKLLGNDTSTGSIVLITSTIISKEDMAALRRLCQQPVKVYIILLDAGALSETSYKEILDATTNARLFYIPAEKVSSTKYSLDFMTLFYDALGSVVAGYTWGRSQSGVVIAQEAFEGNDEVNFTFYIDETVRKEMGISLTWTDLNDSPLVHQQLKLLYNGVKQSYAVGNKGFPNPFVLVVKNPPVGKWTLIGTRRTPETVIARVFAKDGNNKELEVRVWTSVQQQPVIYEKGSPPLILYAEVCSGIHPVSDVVVTAVIQHPKLQQVSLELLDNGLGDPDITCNDGIYSRYFTSFSTSGYYVFLVHVKDKNGTYHIIKGSGEKERICCGSFVPPEDGNTEGNFSRIASYGSFYLIKSEKNGDIYPPNQILDLSVINVELNTFTLQWTAPGNDYDDGQAKDYQIKMFENRKNAKLRFTKTGMPITPYNSSGQQVKPSHYGAVDKIVVKIMDNQESGYYLFGIRASDAENNTSSVSNLVEVYWKNPIYAGKSFITIKPVPDPNSTGSTQSSGDILAIVLGGIAGVILLPAAVISIFILYRRKRSLK